MSFKDLIAKLAIGALALVFAGVAAENLGAQDPGYFLTDYSFSVFGIGVSNVDGSNVYNVLPNLEAPPPPDFSGGCSLVPFFADGQYLRPLFPSAPQDGSLIAFAASTEELVFVMNRDGSGVRQVTSGGHARHDGKPVISPDGTRIAFLSQTGPPNNTFQVFTVSVDGSNRQQVTPEVCIPGDCTSASGMAWSPDSTQLAFAGHFPGLMCPFADATMIINADGTGQQFLACNNLGGGPAMDWSPDGTRIAWADDNGSGPIIRQVAPDGTPLEVLTQTQLGGLNTLDPGAFRYSPDSTRLAYANSVAGFRGISFINVDGTGRQDAINDGNFHHIWWQPGPATLPLASLTLGPDPLAIGPTFPQQLSAVLRDSAGNILSRSALGFCTGDGRFAVSNEIGLVSFSGSPGPRTPMVVENGGLASNVITAIPQPADPPVSFRPAAWDFGNQGVTTTSGTQLFTLTNTGSAVLNINAISFIGDNAADFAFDPAVTTCPLGGGSVAMGDSCAMGVAFSPSDIGTRIAQINVDDDAAGSPQNVPLAGTGTALAAPARTQAPNK